MEQQYVGIDLHRRRSVIVRMDQDGEKLETVRVDNDPVALGVALAEAGPDPEVAMEATYGWYAARRGRKIARVAAARKLLTLVYYGMRDGRIRCLAEAG